MTLTSKILDFTRKSLLTFCIGICIGGLAANIYKKNVALASVWGIALVQTIGWRQEVAATARMRKQIDCLEKLVVVEFSRLKEDMLNKEIGRKASTQDTGRGA